MSEELFRIYKFIDDVKSKNGGTEGFIGKVDTNSDGVILKSEFEAFVNSNWTGSGLPSDDIIEQFWKSIDVNNSESRIKETNLKNYRSVTAEEIDRVEEVVKNGEELKALIDKLNVNAPKNLSAQQKALWVAEMEQKLNAYYKDWMTGEISDEFALTAKYTELVHQITPYHAAEDIMRNVENSLKSYNYNWKIDWERQLGRNVQNHIRDYLKTNPNATGDQVVSEAQKMVNGMLERAEVATTGPTEEFKQTMFTELQKVFLRDILNKSSEVSNAINSVRSNVSENAKSILFERFLSFYYHESNKSKFGEIKSNTVPTFLEWFEQYGKDILAGIEEVTPTPEVPEASKWGCKFSGVQSSYTIESGKYAWGKGSVAVTKDNSAYTGAIKITIPDRTYIDEFTHWQSDKTKFDFDTDSIDGPKTVKFDIVVTDVASGEEIGRQTITVNVKAPTKTEPTNQELVNKLGNAALSLDSSSEAYIYNYWVGNSSDYVESLSECPSFLEMYNNGYNIMVASSDKDYTTSDSAKLGYDDEGICSYDRMLNYAEGSDYEVAIDNWIKTLGERVRCTMNAYFDSSILSKAVDNVTTKYIDDLRAKTTFEELLPSSFYDDDLVEAFSDAVNSESNKSGYKAYECACRYYVGVNFKAFVDDIINEYKRLGGTV